MAAYALRDRIISGAHQELDIYPEFLRALLYHRGIKTKEEAEAFLNPDYEDHLHDPFLLPDMDRATERILSAFEKEQKIIIYSDYDMDGGPGGVILHDFFKKIGYQHFRNYIPHRHEEGYGLNTPAVEQFAEEGTKLLVTVDCGITDREPVARAGELGIDVIITDHHLPNGKQPSAFAIVNPKRADSRYPFDGLCGAGIAFKLVQALLGKLPSAHYQLPTAIPRGWEKWLLDMAGLATIADMVPLTGENRALAYYGLRVLRKSPRPGLGQLCRNMRIEQRHLTEDDVGFMIGPRLNAASRMGEAMDAFHLLSTNDPARAGELADHLERVNNERKGAVASVSREIKKRIRTRGEPSSVLVMGDPRWRPALLGLVANNLVEEHARPVFLWGREGGGVIKGSCRSDGSVDLVELMSHAHDAFLEYGGHKYSGGFSLSHELVHELEKRLLKSYEEVKNENHVKEEIIVDKKLSLDDVSWKTYNMIEQLAPFGEGNPKPLFVFAGATIKNVRTFGKGGDHLELSFERKQGGIVRAIGFFMKPEQFERDLSEGACIDLVATMERSLFRNYPELRLRIVDIL